MNAEDFTDHHLSNIYNLLEEIEEEDPKIAEVVAMNMMFKISKRWQDIRESNQKRKNLTDIENIN